MVPVANVRPDLGPWCNVIWLLPRRPFLARNAVILAEGATGTIWQKTTVCVRYSSYDDIASNTSVHSYCRPKVSKAEACHCLIGLADIIRVVIGLMPSGAVMLLFVLAKVSNNIYLPRHLCLCALL